jgi:uncharacterized protein
LPSNFCTVKKHSSAFVIHFVGLKLGTHEYDFEIDKTFFEDINYSLIEDGKVHAHVSLQKKETMMICEYTITGTVFTNCDRCNDPVELPINGTYRIVYKFGEELSDDENLIVLHPESFELDIAPQLYEFMCVSLPARILHKPGECNEEMMTLYDSYIVNPGEEEDDDDEWDDDDEDWDDDDDLGDDDEDDDSDEPEDNSDKPIDPRWSALKNLN